MSGFTNCDDKLYLNKNISLFCDVFFVTSVTFLAVVHVPIDSGKPLIEMCWFYMGIVLIALGLAYICQTGKCGKKVSQTILASPYTLRQRGEKVPQTILASFYTLPLMGNAHMKSTHFKKGLPSLIHNILQISLFCLCFCSLCSLVYIF